MKQQKAFLPGSYLKRMPFCFQVFNKFYSIKPIFPPQSNQTFLLPHSAGLLFLCCFFLFVPLCFGDDPGLGDAAGDPFIQHLPSTPVSPLSTGQHNSSSVLWGCLQGADCSFQQKGRNHLHLGVLNMDFLKPGCAICYCLLNPGVPLLLCCGLTLLSFGLWLQHLVALPSYSDLSLTSPSRRRF